MLVTALNNKIGYDNAAAAAKKAHKASGAPAGWGGRVYLLCCRMNPCDFTLAT